MIKKEDKNFKCEFVLWFMGSKQDPNSTISTEGIIQRSKL
jgi:hypothetical protein